MASLNQTVGYLSSTPFRENTAHTTPSSSYMEGEGPYGVCVAAHALVL